MALTEFALIDRFFSRQRVKSPHTALGVGDDCALIDVPAGFQLAVTTDTLVEGVHFFPHAEPESLGHKVLAVNLSDLAAMGAEPQWVCLALTLPRVDETWIAAFAKGFLDLAAHYQVELIGGDTTRGPLASTVQAMGLVPAGAALTRGAAKPGDTIYVTGNLGDAALGLEIERGHRCANGAVALQRLHRPLPRIETALELRPQIAACIDVSDGLAADLGHILDASGVGAQLDWANLPLSPAVRRYIDDSGNWNLPLRGGDDYELCFTVRPEHRQALEARVRDRGMICTAVGTIDADKGLRLRKGGRVADLGLEGYEHFS